MSIYEAILKRRTVRKFKQVVVADSLLEKMVNAARVSPSAANLQPLEYIVVRDKELKEDIFKNVKWAAYIAPQGTPKEGEKPMAYIAVVFNSKVGSAFVPYDLGAAVMAMLLTAWEEGLGCCWIKACDKIALKKLLKIPATHEIDSVIALGCRAETPEMEESDTNIKYYLNPEGVLRVPKKRAQTLTHWEQF